jgi:uncharacterized membrane protein SpoIIM required for sporulation
VSLERFEAENAGTWDELERLIRRAGTRPSSLDGAELRSLGTLYRSTSADLAQARRRFPGDPIIGRLEALVTRSRALVYARRPQTSRFIEFFTTEYWQVLMDRPRLLAGATALLLIPAAIGWILAAAQPAETSTLLPTGFLWVTEPQASGTDQGLSATGLTGFSTAILVNNIRVTILAFALGITFGIGTAFVIAANGFILGAVAGLAVGAGNTALLIEAVAAHGLLELSCIVVAGVAGLRMGSALVSPGLRPRRIALRDEALVSVKLVLGTAPWLVLAGFVEGFVSRTGTSAGPAILIGLLLGGLFWGLAVTRSANQNLASDLARR